MPLLGFAARARAQPAAAEAPHDADFDELKALLETPVESATASHAVSTLRESPSVVVVISAQELRSWGYQNVGEALEHVVGMYLIDDHTIPNLAIRGVSGGLAAEGGIAKVMIDGRPVDFRPTSGVWLGVELVPMTAISRIEVIRGPASAVYGADAFFGVINVVTKSASELGNGDIRLLGGLVGDRPSYVADFALAQTFGRWSAVLAGAADDKARDGLSIPSTSPAPFVPEYRRGDTLSNGLARRSRSLIGKLHFQNDEKALVQELELMFRHGQLARGGDFAEWSQLAQGTDTAGRSSGTLVSLEQNDVAATGTLRWRPSLSTKWAAQVSWGGTADDDRIEVASDRFYIERGLDFVSTNNRVSTAWQRGRFGLAGGVEADMTTTNVGDYTRVFKDGSGTRSANDAPEHTLANIGVFAQGDLALRDEALKLTGGLRFDEHSIYGPQVTGRLAAVYVWNDDVVTKLLYGSAFKAPSPLLLYAQPLRPGGVIGNANLAPQLVHTLETQISYRATRYLNITSDVTYSLLLDKAEFVPSGVNQTAENLATMHVGSFETTANLVVGASLRAYLSFELQAGKRESHADGFLAQVTTDALVIYPEAIARAGVHKTWDLCEGLQLSTGTQVIVAGRRLATDYNVAENGESYRLPTYAKWDAVIGLDVNRPNSPPFSLVLRGTNLLDHRAADPGFTGIDYPRAGRGLFLELRRDL